MIILIKYVGMIIAAIIAITIHGYCKALVAYRMGDHDVKTNGSLSLNPMKQIDPIGLITLISFNIGWSQPVRFNSYNFKDKKKATLAILLGGIIGSLLLAVLALVVQKAIIKAAMGTIMLGTVSYITVIISTLDSIVAMSIILAVFSLVPLPPLEMTKLISAYSPTTYFKIVQYEKPIQMIFIVLLFFGIIQKVLMPIVSVIYTGLSSCIL